ncbi:hypothetical protein [uncultured Megasphaera sp.]|uniref:hypothetical protein n=1 Tax=uncultured Megasphaera sp. TaxID=165188 RepID=UPI002069E52C|nr:hypothetical protein [uncultured Megasphaera sp.]DAQ39028.1 MAG TPA: PemK-like protein [Caudoviricetes sp.]
MSGADFKNPKNKPLLRKNITALSNDQKSYLINQTDTNYHRAAVLYYGLNTQLVKLKNEQIFHEYNRGKFITLKRGSIIKIDFGLPLGAEFGGLHYAIVLHDSHSGNPLVNVLPIKSFKGNNFHETDILFNSEIYDAMRGHLSIIKSLRRHRLKTFRKMLKTKSQRIEHLFELVHKEGFSITEPSFDLLGAIFSGSDELRQALKDSQVIKKEDLLKEQARILKQYDNIKKIAAESIKFNRKSIAVTSQIRCLSKMRIKFPLNRFDPLYNIKVDTATLQKIQTSLKKYYI